MVLFTDTAEELKQIVKLQPPISLPCLPAVAGAKSNGLRRGVPL
jgi:hypothetical protein